MGGCVRECGVVCLGRWVDGWVDGWGGGGVGVGWGGVLLHRLKTFHHFMIYTKTTAMSDGGPISYMGG